MPRDVLAKVILTRVSRLINTSEYILQSLVLPLKTKTSGLKVHTSKNRERNQEKPKYERNSV